MVEAAAFAPGERVGGFFRVVRLIGRGGMGEVYEVEDERTRTRRALKTVLPRLVSNAKTLARFEREFEYSRRISHPNVLEIFEVFETRSPASGTAVPCMVMELLEGETVADRLGRGELFSSAEAGPIVCQMAAALSAAHEQSIVHRDLKPDNVFLVPGGGEPRVILTDFGVARLDRPSRENLTESNVVIGTPTYMAPEQLELEDAIPASDVYTLGLVVYEMLTGRMPFEAEVPIQMVFKRVTEDPVPPQRHRPDLEPLWIEVVLRCLARRPEDRYADPREIVETLAGPGAVERYLVKRGKAGAAWLASPWLWGVAVALVILAVLLALR